MAPEDSVEEKSLPFKDLQAGVKLNAGHAVTIVISDLKASPEAKPDVAQGGSTPPPAATGDVSPPVSPG